MEDEVLIKKIMPHSLEAEQSVIGSMLMDVEAIDVAAEYLAEDDFYARQNGVMFTAMVELWAEHKPVDVITLSDRLREKGAPEEITGTEFIKAIIGAVPTSANIRQYVRIVHEKSTLRKLIKASEKISADCYMQNDGLDDILEETEKSIFNLIQTRNSKEHVPIKEVVMTVLRRIEEAAKTKGHLTGVSTGFADLDKKTNGLQPSDFILIAGRPSMGKTAFALSLAKYAALKKDLSVAIFSLEMSKEQLVHRLLSMDSNIDAQVIRTGELSDSQWESLMDSSDAVGKSKIIIDDTSGISVTELRSKCRKYKLEHDIQMVIVDYIQLMSSGKNVESRQQEISDISRALKGIARELDIPVVVLSQLNRAADSRQDHRPLLSDIRESGAIEQDADVIMFLYRDDYYHPDTEEKNVAEIIIAKQRNGPVGTIKLAWQPMYTKFVGLERTFT
ncbi:MAG: replicative DNA helicase [Lachnospiraceae bacterium]|jgi:replicative DNA helicase